MKKYIILALLGILVIPNIHSQTRYTYTTTRHTNSDSEYYLERKLKENKTNGNIQAGILTRFGYSYNDDAFMYGVSVYYHFDGALGISMGFDGYSMSKVILKNAETGELYEDTRHYPLPMWDIRAGLLLGKYFAFGALAGKCRIESCIGDIHHISIHENKNLWGSKMGDGIYGGYITFILPITTHFGMNMDFALTNHTGFNIALGVNACIPIK